MLLSLFTMPLDYQIRIVGQRNNRPFDRAEQSGSSLAAEKQMMRGFRKIVRSFTSFRSRDGAIKRPLLFMSIMWTALIYYASFMPGNSKRYLHLQGHEHFLLHLLAFLVLAVLYLETSASLRRRAFLLLIGVLIAVSTEFGEHIAFRNRFEYLDVLADLCGICTGAAACIAYHVFSRRLEM